MLRTKETLIYATIFYLLLISSCAVVTWEKLDLHCNIAETQTYFNEQSIQLIFSSEPIKGKAERYVQLKADGESVEVYTNWSGNGLFISPEKGWRKGKEYELMFTGSVEMVDGRIYKKNITRHFTYGEVGQKLSIINQPVGNDSTVLADTPLIFRFNKSISVTSFAENFKVNPHTETDIVFSLANTKVIVLPKNGWGINTIYNWTLSELLSDDEYSLAKEYSGRFYSPVDTVQPQLVKICPVEQGSGGLTWREDLSVNGNVREQQPIGFIFSKPMDFDRVESGITFSPSLKGYFEAVENDATRFVFFPEENYQIETRYTITVSEQISDINDIALFTEHIEYFTAGDKYITVESITLNSDTPITVYTDKLPVHTLNTNATTNARQLMLKVNFSSPIDKIYQKAAVDSISVSLFFPSAAASPSLLSVAWNVPNTEVTMLWEGFTTTASYRIEIQSGVNGVMNAQGESIEEDVCVYFEAL